MADFSREDFKRAIEIADKGYRKYYKSTSFPERGAQLRRWFDLINENLEDCKFPLPPSVLNLVKWVRSSVLRTVRLLLRQLAKFPLRPPSFGGLAKKLQETIAMSFHLPCPTPPSSPSKNLLEFAESLHLGISLLQ